MMDGSDTLCVCLEKKCKLLKKYLDATLRMKQSLDSGDMKKLCVFLEKRQDFIKDVDEINRKIYRFKKTNSCLMEHTSGATKGRTDQSVTALKKIIEKLSNLEKDCMETLQEKSERLKIELFRMRSGRQAIKRYDRQENMPKFLDMKR